MKRDTISFSQLMRSYVRVRSVQLYAALALTLVVILFCEFPITIELLYSALAAVLIYPFVEYSLHRFLLHSPYLYRSRWTSALWKRVHYDHHVDPANGDVLFGAVHTMIPVAVILPVPIGFVIGGAGGSIASCAVGFMIMNAYELCHCAWHLNYQPRSRYFAHLKFMHATHHHLNEHGNFGITSSMCDRLFGTYYARDALPARSSTTRTLGYDELEMSRYPWVAALVAGEEKNADC